MKKVILKSLMLVGSVFALLGCGGTTDTGNTDGNGEVVTTTVLPANVQAAVDGPSSVLNQELLNTLAYMGNEERLAYDVYNEFYSQYGTNQFTNIATKSEYKHITAVQALIQKYKLNDDVNFTNVDLDALGYMNTAIEDMKAGEYDISEIQKLYDDLVSQGSSSEIDALKVGCIIEVVDVTDLDADILLAESQGASDLVTVFTFLREGSYSHYWAFDAALKSMDIVNGCCAVEDYNGLSLCQDYPQKD